MQPITVERVFRLRGEFDMANAAELEVALRRFARRDVRDRVTVDAEELRFIDSSGISALLRVRHALEREGRTMRIVNLPAVTQRVLEVLDLTEMLGADVR